MGGMPYYYFVKYEPDLQQALHKLRDREFKAGRYNPVIPFMDFSALDGPNPPAPGAQHASIDDAMEDTDADGTRSILDLEAVADEPDFGVAARVSEEELQELFGTTRPTREMVQESDELFEDIERGQGVCIIIYKNDQPDEIFFAGYSFD